MTAPLMAGSSPEPMPDGPYRTAEEIAAERARSLEEPMDDTEQPPASEWTATGEYIAALHREHDGYVQAGLDDRADEVAEQLKLCGQKPPAKRRART